MGYAIALDNYDELGRYREEQNGLPVDTSSRLAVGNPMPEYIEFAGPQNLGQALSESRAVRQCFVEQLARRVGLTELSESELACARLRKKFQQVRPPGA